MKTLRLGYLSTMYHTSHLIKNLGWLETGLGVKTAWTLFGTGPAMVKAFQEDRLDIGYIGLPPAMIGIGQGLPLKCVAGGHAEGTVMIGRQDITPFSVSGSVREVLLQFRGKRVGAPSAGSIHDVIARFLVRQNGLKDISIVNYAWADLIPDAIQSGDICGAFGTPPLAVVADTWFSFPIVLPASEIWPFNPSYGIVATEKMLKAKQLLKGFIRLHEKACNMIISFPERAAEVIAAEIKVVDRRFVQKVLSVSPCYCAALPPEYINATMAFLPALKNMNYIKRDLSEKTVFDFSYIRALHPEPHHYNTPLNTPILDEPC